MRFIKYVAVFIFGFLIAKVWYEVKEKKHSQQQTQVLYNGIKNMRKLVVAQGRFSEILSYSDSKKYMYDYLSFDKKAVVAVNAKVEVGYDLSQLAIQLDSVSKRIVINAIPEEEVLISPEVKYFDLSQSTFNTFSKQELNEINQKSIAKLKETITITSLQDEAKKRLFEELSNLYQLSVSYGWELVDNTETKFYQSHVFKD